MLEPWRQSRQSFCHSKMGTQERTLIDRTARESVKPSIPFPTKECITHPLLGPGYTHCELDFLCTWRFHYSIVAKMQGRPCWIRPLVQLVHLAMAKWLLLLGSP